jgi:DinB family protein
MPVPQQLDAFRAAREDTFKLVAPLSQAQLDRSPAPGKWSAGEVLDHLSKTDAMYRREIGLLVDLAKSGRRAYVKRGFSDLDASPASVPKSWLRFLEVPFGLMSRLMPKSMGAAMAANRKVHFRNPEGATPQPGRPAAELASNLHASFAALEELFTANPDLDWPSMIHQHPLFGVNSVLQILDFITSHERRHQAQIRDALSAQAA